MPASTSQLPTTARRLQKEWGVNVRHALYHHDGSWYHVLERFPAALFDPNGYVIFETKDDYLASKYLQHGDHLHVEGGIHLIPGYVLRKSPLPPAAAAVLRRIVDHIDTGTVRPGRPETYIGYKRIHDDLNFTLKAESYGDSLSKQGLGVLAEWTKENGYPAVTGIVVDTSTKFPGAGYFTLFKPKGDQYAWWEDEIRKSLEFDWHLFVPEADPLPQTTQTAADIQATNRVQTLTYRILRDTELARKVKAKCCHKCQICGHTLILTDGSAYAEAHHIKPLGTPHDGPDIEGNILCVCPNHHAALDYGAITIEKAVLTGPHRDMIRDEFIEYHNRHISTGTPRTPK
jgi:hypothetical protein